VRAQATQQGFGLVDRTEMVTAARELARNVLVHGTGGTLHIQALDDGPRRG
jgi:serine/threonine-protein kinase RsbT